MDGHHVLVGRPAWVQARTGRAAFDEEQATYAAQGHTPVAVAVDGEPAAALAFGDRVCEEAAEMLASMRDGGKVVYLLSGDHPEVVRAVAAALDLPEGFAHGGVTPEQKQAFVERPDDPLCETQRRGTMQRNFQGYSTHAGTALLGFGISSIGQLEDAYVQNVKGLRAYYAALDDGRLPVHRGYRLTDDDRLRRHVIMQLMCQFELDVLDVEDRFDVDFGYYFADALEQLEPMERDGLVTVTPYHISITDAGRFLVRNVVMPFDCYLKRTTDRSIPTYSKTI